MKLASRAGNVMATRSRVIEWQTDSAFMLDLLLTVNWQTLCVVYKLISSSNEYSLLATSVYSYWKLNQRENTGVKFLSSMELPFTGCDEVVGSIWTWLWHLFAEHIQRHAGQNGIYLWSTSPQQYLIRSLNYSACGFSNNRYCKKWKPEDSTALRSCGGTRTQRTLIVILDKLAECALPSLILIL